MNKTRLKTGQTLIETLAALFVLVMGLAACSSLATYAIGTSTEVTKDIIGIGLAREGLEAVINMRDTNWLTGTLSTQANNGCYDYPSNSFVASCYRNWLSQKYCLDPGDIIGVCPGTFSGRTAYFLTLNETNTTTPWTLTKTLNVSGNFGLIFDPTDSLHQGFYTPGPSAGVLCLNTSKDGSLAISDYCREIVLASTTPAGTPFDPTITMGSGTVTPFSLLQVYSRVWWVDKGCPRVENFASAPKKCSVELDTYLTNWKNY
jgi:hypothetical protein